MPKQRPGQTQEASTRYADAAGTASGTGKKMGQNIQKAMEQAIAQAQKEGVTDPKIIKERIQAARQGVRDAAAETEKQKAQAVSEAK